MAAAPDLAIRLARAAFNRALAERDLDTIAALLVPDVVMVTGSDSAVLAGRKAQLLAWKREFAAAHPTTCVRTPESITLSPAEPIAMEHGRWQGTGPLPSSGTYVAKWREAGGRWRIEAEIYVTLA